MGPVRRGADGRLPHKDGRLRSAGWHGLGWNAVGYNGSEIETPTIDRLAADGAKLYRYYPFPCCKSTRVAGMTRHAPLRFGVLGPIFSRLFSALQGPLRE